MKKYLSANHIGKQSLLHDNAPTNLEERGGSVVEWLIADQRVAGLSLTGGTALFLIEQDTILRLACADAEGDRGPDPPLENHKLFTRLFSGRRAWAPLTKIPGSVHA